MAKIYHDTSFYGTGRIECRLYHPGNAQVRQRNDQLHRGKDGKSQERRKETAFKLRFLRMHFLIFL